MLPARRDLQIGLQNCQADVGWVLDRSLIFFFFFFFFKFVLAQILSAQSLVVFPFHLYVYLIILLVVCSGLADFSCFQQKKNKIKKTPCSHLSGLWKKIVFTMLFPPLFLSFFLYCEVTVPFKGKFSFHFSFPFVLFFFFFFALVSYTRKG